MLGPVLDEIEMLEELDARVNQRFEDVLEASSLGTPAAIRIRASTPDSVVDDIRRRAGQPIPSAEVRGVDVLKDDCPVVAPPSVSHTPLAEILGLAMARRAADILDRHRAALTSTAAHERGETRMADQPAGADDAQFALDNAIFTAVLDAANECLGRFDERPIDQRWCDALLQLMQLAELSRQL